MKQAINYRHLLKRYEFYAPRYDKLFRRYSAATLGKALEAIPMEGEAWLLDVACGTGMLADMLLRKRPNLHITGVDLSPHMLERARQRIAPVPGRVEWLVGHAEQLPVESHRFDVLTCTNAFHLVQDAPAALAEFRRVLKREGKVVLVDWCLDFPIMRVRDAALRVSDRQKRHIRRLFEMVNLMQEAGFAVEHSERFLATPVWGLMCVVAVNGPAPSTSA